jgi:hypothetical protein
MSQTIPAGVTAGMLMVWVMENKLSTTVPASVTAGWTKLTDIVGGAGADIAQSGPVRTSVYYRIADGSESGTTISFTLSNVTDNSCHSRVIVYQKDPQYFWDLQHVTATDNTSGNRVFRATSGSNLGLTVDDVVLLVVGHNDNTLSTAVSGTNTDNGLPNGLSMSSITFNTLDKFVDSGTSFGNDSRLVVIDTKVTSGTASSTITLQLGTGTVPTAGGFSGSMVAVRLRQVAMDITSLTPGATSFSATGSVAAPLPASIQNGDALFYVIGAKVQGNQAETPAGWRRIAEDIAWDGSKGADQGGVKETVFFKEVDGTETSSITCVVPNANCLAGTIYAFRKPANPLVSWNVDVAAGHFNEPGNTAYRTRAWKSIQSAVGDFYLVTNTVNTDASTWTVLGLQQASTVFTTVNLKVHESGTSLGNDLKQFASTFKVSSGAGIDAPVYTATAPSASTSPENPIGICHFVKMRLSHAQQVWKSPLLRIILPEQVENSSLDGAGGIWNGLQADYQAVPDYSVVTYAGSPHFKLLCDLTRANNTPSVIQRRMELYVGEWQPSHPPGTECAYSFKLVLPSDHTPAFGGVDIFQSHTGSAVGYTSNSPLFALEATYPSEFGGATPGTLSVHYDIPNVNSGGSNTRKYKHTTGVVLQAGQTYNITIWVKYGYSGSAFLKVYVNGSTIFDSTTEYPAIATIAQLDSDLGSVPDVGGAGKFGIYHHMFNTVSDAQANIAYGHSKWTSYIRAIGYAKKHPTDTQSINILDLDTTNY